MANNKLHLNVKGQVACGTFSYRNNDSLPFDDFMVYPQNHKCKRCAEIGMKMWIEFDKQNPAKLTEDKSRV